MSLTCKTCGAENLEAAINDLCSDCFRGYVGRCQSRAVEKFESNLERAKRLTQQHVDAGLAAPWVMGDYEQRDRFNAARDRRASFAVVKPARKPDPDAS